MLENDTRKQSAKSYTWAKVLLLCGAAVLLVGAFHQTNFRGSSEEMTVAEEAPLSATEIHGKIEDLVAKAQKAFPGFEDKLKEVIEVDPSQIKAQLGNFIGTLKDKIPGKLMKILTTIQTGGDAGPEIQKSLTDLWMDGSTHVAPRLKEILDKGKELVKPALTALLAAVPSMPLPLVGILNGFINEGVDQAAEHLKDLLDHAVVKLGPIISSTAVQLYNKVKAEADKHIFRGTGTCKKTIFDYHINCGWRGNNCGAGCEAFRQEGCFDDCCARQKEYCKTNTQCMTDRKCPGDFGENHIN